MKPNIAVSLETRLKIQELVIGEFGERITIDIVARDFKKPSFSTLFGNIDALFKSNDGIRYFAHINHVIFTASQSGKTFPFEAELDNV